MLFAILLYFSALTTVSVTGNISLLPGVIPDSVHAPQYSLHSFIANAIDSIVKIGFLPSTKNATLSATPNIPMGPIQSNGEQIKLQKQLHFLLQFFPPNCNFRKLICFEIC